MKAIEFLKFLPHTPLSKEKGGQPSNSELRRWLKKGSVRINGLRPAPGDHVSFPIRELIFFEGSPSRCTVILDDSLFDPVSSDALS